MSSIADVPPYSVAPAVRINRVLLQQGLDLLERLGAQRYREPVPACFNSAVGGHLRHVIEHYQGVLSALESGGINYENRARDTMIETSVDHAADVIRDLMTDLDQLRTDRPMTIASETAPGAVVATSLGRELEFLVSHTVHHYALIAVIVGLLGVKPLDDFGMAPSTLKFQATQAACAH